jgi:hypothetical protein
MTQYDPTKILVLLSDDLQQETVATWDRLQDFIGLQRMDHPLLRAEERLTLSYYGPQQSFESENENATVACRRTADAAGDASLFESFLPAI